MKAKHIGLMVLLAIAGSAALGQVPRKYIRAGNKQFKEGKFSDAEVDYRKAVAKNPDYYKGQFNLGDAMYEQKNMEESGKIFNQLSETAKDPKVKSSALYNYGNTLLSQKKYKEAMEAYKKSLLLNPKDENAKYNYEYARKKMIQQQKQQKQQQKNKDKNKDKKKDKNKDKQKQDQKKQDKQKQDQNKKDQNKDKKQQQKPQDKKDQQQKQQQNKDEQGKKGDQQKKQQQQAKPQQMSKKDAQRMLNALKNDEKKTLMKLQKKKAKAGHAKKSDIDW